MSRRRLNAPRKITVEGVEGAVAKENWGVDAMIRKGERCNRTCRCEEALIRFEISCLIVEALKWSMGMKWRQGVDVDLPSKV